MLLHTKVYKLGTSEYTHGIYYSPTVDYFGREHLPYAILALTLLTVFVFIPTIALILYPFRLFQKFFLFSRSTGTFFMLLLTPIKDVTKMVQSREHLTLVVCNSFASTSTAPLCYLSLHSFSHVLCLCCNNACHFVDVLCEHGAIQEGGQSPALHRHDMPVSAQLVLPSSHR